MAKNLNEGAPDNLLVGLDLGTTKTTCLVAEALGDGSLHVIGVGTAPSTGMKKGAVINIEATVGSISKAVGEAERMAGVKVRSAFVGVGGEQVKGLTSHGVIAVGRKDKEITHEDVERVLEAAKAMPIPQDREILHVLTQEFLIDNQDGIRDPVGMSGVRLESVVHVITGSVTSIQNVLKSMERVPLAVDELILQHLASATSTLTHDEKELGVALVDIGGGTTDMVVYMEGAVRHVGLIPAGGNQFTRDLAIGLRTPNDEAESIKRRYGCAKVSLTADTEEIHIAGVGGRVPRPVPRRSVAEIMQPRAEEVLSLIKEELKRSGFDGKLAAGIVLTGGSSQIQGLQELAEEILQHQVRLAKPRPLKGLGDVVQGAEFAAAVGLVQWGARLRAGGGASTSSSSGAASSGSGDSLFDRLKKFFKEYF